MHLESIYGKRASKQGLDPENTSILGLCCVENGLPYDSSFLDLAAVKMGKKPGEISLNNAKEYFGENWTSTITK